LKRKSGDVVAHASEEHGAEGMDASCRRFPSQIALRFAKSQTAMRARLIPRRAGASPTVMDQPYIAGDQEYWLHLHQTSSRTQRFAIRYTIRCESLVDRLDASLADRTREQYDPSVRILPHTS
jgi:hypothetical protein